MSASQTKHGLRTLLKTSELKKKPFDSTVHLFIISYKCFYNLELSEGDTVQAQTHDVIAHSPRTESWPPP